MEMIRQVVKEKAAGNRADPGDRIDLPDGDALLQDIWGTRFHHEFQTFSGRAV